MTDKLAEFGDYQNGFLKVPVRVRRVVKAGVVPWNIFSKEREAKEGDVCVLVGSAPEMMVSGSEFEVTFDEDKS